MEKYQEGLGGARAKGEPPPSQVCRAQNPTWAPQCLEAWPTQGSGFSFPRAQVSPSPRHFPERRGTVSPGVQGEELLGFSVPQIFDYSLTG